MKPAGKRNLQLDVLRGVAVLLVFGRHLELARPDGVVGAFADVWFRIGWLGVDLFFVLSGFLIGGLLLSELDRHGRIDVPRFLIRRGLKIYPAYFVFLAYLMLMPTAKVVLRGGDGWDAFANNWSQYWPNLLFLQNYVGTNPAGHTWTLAVEEHFYLALPFVLVLLAALGRARSVVFLCAMSVFLFLGLRCLAVFTHDPFAIKMSATHLRLDALLFGVAVRGVAQFWPVRFSAARHWRPLLLLFGVACWLPNLFIEPATALIRTVGLTLTFLGSAAFLVAAYHTRAADFGRAGGVISRGAALLAWIGVYSYAIYLWHITALGILGHQLGERFYQWFRDYPAVAWSVSALALSAGAVLAGVLASKVVEWPVLRLRDRFFPSRSGSLPVASGSLHSMQDAGVCPPEVSSSPAAR